MPTYKTTSPIFQGYRLYSHKKSKNKHLLILFDSLFITVIFIQGGESTREEMCFTFMYYYPATNLDYCVGAQLVGEEFSEQHLRWVATTSTVLYHYFRGGKY